jgi:hypothetical protein
MSISLPVVQPRILRLKTPVAFGTEQLTALHNVLAGQLELNCQLPSPRGRHPAAVFAGMNTSFPGWDTPLPVQH